MICPDCGLQTKDSSEPSKAAFVCPECLQKAGSEPIGGWPIIARWVSAGRGRGVFARDDLPRGAIVERCWVMPLPPDESIKSVAMPTVNRYLFPWVNGMRCLPSGQGLLYNFDRFDVTTREPNVQCVLRQGLSAIEFRTLRDVRAGEELTWDYSRAVTKNA